MGYSKVLAGDIGDILDLANEWKTPEEIMRVYPKKYTKSVISKFISTKNKEDPTKVKKHLKSGARSTKAENRGNPTKKITEREGSRLYFILDFIDKSVSLSKLSKSKHNNESDDDIYII